MPTIQPAFDKESVNVAFVATPDFAPYLATALASLMSHASPERLYDVMAISTGMAGCEVSKLEGLAERLTNISVRVFNACDVAIEPTKTIKELKANEHWAPCVYYRLFLPSIFGAYDRLISLDCDTIILDDLAKLFGTDLGGRAIGAVREFWGISSLLRNPAGSWARQLALKDPTGYFNSGTVVMDLARMRQAGHEAKCLEWLYGLGTPQVMDQDVLNHALEGDTAILDASWNSFAPWAESLGKGLGPDDLPEALYTEYLESAKAPKIIHYISTSKPWDLPHLPLADTWWKYADTTPYRDWLRFNALKKLYERQDVALRRLYPFALPGLLAVMGWEALLAKLSDGPARESHLARLQTAKNDYRLLDRRRHASKSRAMLALRDWLGF